MASARATLREEVSHDLARINLNVTSFINLEDKGVYTLSDGTILRFDLDYKLVHAEIAKGIDELSQKLEGTNLQLQCVEKTIFDEEGRNTGTTKFVFEVNPAF